MAAYAQYQPYNQAVIWNGFKHNWTYNHRCNRLGDYVQYNNGKPTAVHTSETRLGQDSTRYTSSYTLVSSNDAVFKEGEASVKIQGKEKSLISQTVTVVLDAEDWLKNKKDYTTLLNGFDLRSEKGSDKIQLLKMSVEDGEYSKETGKVSFRIYVSIVLDCQSAECPEFNNKVDYELKVYYLLIGSDENEMRSAEHFFSKSYSWDRKEEISELPEERVIGGTSGNLYNNAAVGIKSFSFVLNSAQWLLQMNNTVSAVEYYPQTGDMVASVDLLFKEWQDGMKGTDVAPGKSKFSVRKKGWAVLDADAVLLQFRNANVVQKKNSGSMYWKYKENRSERENCISVYEIPVN